VTRAGTSEQIRDCDALVVHACWEGDALHLWGEDVRKVAAQTSDEPDVERQANERALATHASEGASSPHPFAADAQSLRGALAAFVGGADTYAGSEEDCTLHLPSEGSVPALSLRASHLSGRTTSAVASPPSVDATGVCGSIATWMTPTLAFAPMDALAICSAASSSQSRAIDVDLRFFADAARVACLLVAEGRIVPMLIRNEDGSLRAQWYGWLSDASSRARVVAMLSAMPPAARAASVATPWTMLEDFLHAMIDARCRAILKHEDLADALMGRDPSDSHVAWLTGLFNGESATPAHGDRADRLLRGVRRWLGRLEDQGQDTLWRLLLRVEEPDLEVLEAKLAATPWRIGLFLEPRADNGRPIPADEVWRLPVDEAIVDGRRLDAPHDLLLAELDRAARLCPLLERAMRDEHPLALEISALEAQKFLREDRPVLLEQGIGVAPPAWWGAADARLGARAVIEPIVADQDALTGDAAGSEDSAPDGFAQQSASGGLEQFVRLQWRLAIGDAPISMEELERWAAEGSPFVRFEDRWIELLPKDIEAARELLRLGEVREMPLREAIGVALGAGAGASELPIVGVEAKGWLESVLAGVREGATLTNITQPDGFHGSLRPYQVAGLSWLAFLESHGLGGCLADDMGLGKTIQVIALLLWEREETARTPHGANVGPTLLVVPTSVVSNWLREIKRFAPALRAVAHHGPDRLHGDAFIDQSARVDAVVTTYALAHRDGQDMALVHWRRLVLDEAQKIKNPDAKQTRAVRMTPAQTRIALTGTPVENHLTDLWSIMDFCNPGLLGPQHAFRRTIAAPIERDHDETKRKRLRAVIRPFLLRRLKSDPTVEIDLPDKIETREHCSLTLEQASLYERVVEETLSGVDSATGVRRRGLILAGLTRLKQICNHPAQALSEPIGSAGVDPGFAKRSGKCVRLIEMLEEALDEGDQAIVFSQFRVMADMLAALLRRRFDCDALLFHGGTSREQRERIVDRFEKRDGSAPILVLSLKAGGLGMNLTAANHMFHFDRWWNPAVENQATDRAHRIGQTRTVHVHKFVVSGTLEDRIDEMIEEKKDLAERVVGAGEHWITEMSTDQLRDVLQLRREAIDANGVLAANVV